MTLPAQAEDIARHEREQAVALATQAGQLTIVDDATYEAAGIVVRDVKAHAKKVDEQKRAILDPLNESIKQVRDLFRPVEEQLNLAENTAKRAMATYSEEKEKAAREAAAKARDEARREAERLATEAAEAEAKGDIAQARAKLNEAEDAEVAGFAVQVPAAPKVDGVSYRETWKFEVEDIRKLPADYLMVNEKAIGGVVRAMKGNTRIPGVRVWAERTAVVR